jgi:hypothetical protein
MQDPKLVLVPAAQGSKFYSVLPSSGVGDFAFSRSGSATRINKDGLIETVGNGVSRLNYPLIDGVVKGCPHHILEPERLQKIQYSEDFSQGYWNKIGSSISQNIIISPDGTQNASKLVEDNLNGLKRLRINAISTSGNNTLSFFVKSAERNWILLREAGQTGAYAYFDLENGVVGQSNLAENIEIKQFNDDWYRISFRDSVTSVAIELRLALSDGVDSYQGDGTSGVYIWGAQVESGSYPTSYIPNYGTSATVTRSAETANGSGNSEVFNDSEGVLYAEIAALDETQGTSVLTISDSSLSDRLLIAFVSGKIRGEFVSGGGTITRDASEVFIENFNKIACSYTSNTFKVFVNGLQVGTTGTVTTAMLGIVELAFDRGDSANYFYGNVKDIRYYNTALTDQELQALTSN